MCIRRRSTDRSRGQSLVEFALVFPIVLLVMLGILDFGRAIFAFNSVSNAARTAIRVAIVDQNPAVVEAAALSETVAVSPVVVDQEACTAIGCVYQVTVRHQYAPATPVIGSIVGPIEVSSSSRMPVERAYASAP
jgi:Flp pilus assembly protein TadG